MNAIAKIELTKHITVAFNKLKLAPTNVRRVRVEQSIEDLAASIAYHGLVQGLSVRRELDEAGEPTGFYLVQAGGRRYRALALLVRQKRLNKTAAVPCILSEEGLAEETSLVENEHRLPLHPADQFRAFQALALKGRSVEDIAAAFLTDPKTVQQRLRLAVVSGGLLTAYENEEMTLAQLMAFSVSNDQERQDQVWAAFKQQSEYSRTPQRIRQALMETTIHVDDRRMRFVGVDAYLQAGGTISRDLFEVDNGGWADNVILVEHLIGAKLEAEAAAIKGQGWLWVQHAPSFPYNHTYDMRQIQGQTTISDEDAAEIGRLERQLEHVLAEYPEGEDLPEEVDEAVAQLEKQIEDLQDRDPSYTPEELAIAGCIVSVGTDGSLQVSRGWVRPEDDPERIRECGRGEDVSLVGDPAPTGSAMVTGAVVSNGAPSVVGHEEVAESDEDDHLPDRLRAELTATRTLALRDTVGSNPAIALTALLHQLVSDEFGISKGIECLHAAVTPPRLVVTAPDLAETVPALAIEARRQTWRAIMPSDPSSLWGWLEALTLDQRLALLAHCIGQGVNAQYEKVSQYGYINPQAIERRIAAADHLARSTNLDMVEQGWRPTAENYLSRVPKRQILAAVREAKGERFAAMIDHLKKQDMVREAERLLADTGWLPEVLRTVHPANAAAAAEGEPVVAELPDFLVGAADGAGETASDEPAPLGAAA
jgi:ParB family chromosome partitioning protein